MVTSKKVERFRPCVVDYNLFRPCVVDNHWLSKTQ